jgi:hypothetical protein
MKRESVPKDNRKPTSFYVDKDLYFKVKCYCTVNQLGISDLLNNLFRDELENQVYKNEKDEPETI